MARRVYTTELAKRVHAQVIYNKSRCRRTHIVLFHRTDSDEGQRELAMRIKGIYEKNSQEES